MLKLFVKLKLNKSMKLLIVEMKENSSVLIRLEMAVMAQN